MLTVRRPLQSVRRTVRRPLQSVRRTVRLSLQSVRRTVRRPLQSVRRTVRRPLQSVRRTVHLSLQSVRRTVSLSLQSVRRTVRRPLQSVRRTVRRPLQSVRWRRVWTTVIKSGILERTQAHQPPHQAYAAVREVLQYGKCCSTGSAAVREEGAVQQTRLPECPSGEPAGQTRYVQAKSATGSEDRNESGSERPACRVRSNKCRVRSNKCRVRSNKCRVRSNKQSTATNPNPAELRGSNPTLAC